MLRGPFILLRCVADQRPGDGYWARWANDIQSLQSVSVCRTPVGVITPVEADNMVSMLEPVPYFIYSYET